MLGFEALADPTRRRMVEILAGGERTVTELGREFEMTQPAISFHLRRLRQAGIVRARVDGKHRFYALDRSELEGMEAWLHRNRTFWNERFDAMENDLTRSTTKRRREK